LERVESGVGKAWISLDSLVRIAPFQWFTRDCRKNTILAPFSPKGPARERDAPIEGVQMRTIIHRVSLTQFRLFYNQSSSTPIVGRRKNDQTISPDCTCNVTAEIRDRCENTFVILFLFVFILRIIIDVNIIVRMEGIFRRDEKCRSGRDFVP
jgi:hypothetical protein